MNSYEKYFDDVLFKQFRKQADKSVSNSMIWKQIEAFKKNNPVEYNKQMDEYFKNI